MNKKELTLPTLALLLGSVLCQSLSLTCGKKAGVAETSSLIFLYVNIWYAALLFFLGMQALFWNATLKFIPLSFAYPFNSLSILLTAILGMLLFQEELSLLNMLGIVIIIIGIFVTAKPLKETSNDL